MKICTVSFKRCWRNAEGQWCSDGGFPLQVAAICLPVPGDLPFLGLLSSLVLRKRAIVRWGSSWVSNSRTTLMNRVTRSLLRWCAGGRNVVLIAGKGEAAPAPRMHWHAPTALWQSKLDGIKPRLDRGLSHPPSLVCIGRLSPEKNVPHLIQVMALLKQRGCQPLPRLTLVGHGPERQRLEALVRERDCEDIISFTGLLNRRDLSKQLSQADLCVHASAVEGSPNAWLDAMAHGLPVLACEVPASPWTIGADGERGWRVPQGDVEAFAAKLRSILTEPRDWPGLRWRARVYAETRTLEAWRQQIGEICARQWDVSLVGGKLRAKQPDFGSDGEHYRGHPQSGTSLLSGAQEKAE